MEEIYVTNPENMPILSVDLDQVRSYIRAKMADSHTTIADLAKKTGVAKGTLDNFFDGTTKSPTFDKICLIMMALNASVDEAVGLKTPQPTQVGHSAQTFADIKEAHRETMSAKDEHILHLKQELEAEKARSRRLARFVRLFAIENILIILLLVIDIFSPAWGYFRDWIATHRTSGSMRG